MIRSGIRGFSMNSMTCPQCGGEFQPDTLGPLHDKILKCPYCGHTCDVPDEYEVTREEVINEGPGRVRRVRVTERRSDMPAGSIPMPEGLRGKPLDPQAMIEHLKAQGMVPSDADFEPDGKGGFSYSTGHTDVSSHVTASVQDAGERLRKMMGPGFDPFGGQNVPWGAGKAFARTEERSESDNRIKIVHAGSGSGEKALLIKWLVVLGIVILLIILAVKLL